MRKAHLLLPLVAAMALAGCGNEQPATNAVTQAEAALEKYRVDATSYAPEELSAADATLAAMKKDLAEKDYDAVVDAVPKFNAEVKTLQENVVSKQTLAAAAQREWDELQAAVPKDVEAVQVRVDALGSTRLPKDITKETFETAKADLATAKSAWDEATAAATAGNTTEAADKGREVQAKVHELKDKLGMNPSLAQATMTPPQAADVTPAN